MTEPQPQKPEDHRLDELLSNARWEPIEPERIDRLSNQWHALTNQASESALDSAIGECFTADYKSELVEPKQITKEQSVAVRSRVIWSSVAVVVLLCMVAALIINNVERHGEVATTQPKSAPSTNQPTTETSETKTNRKPAAPRRAAPLPDPDQIFATLAFSRDQRTDAMQKHASLQQWASSVIVAIGNDSNATTTLGVLAFRLDDLMNDWLRDVNRQKRHAARSYFESRRQWERWIWRQHDQSNHWNRIAWARMGTVFASRRSLHRVANQLANPQLASAAARTLARLGSINQIDRAIAAAATDQSTSILLSSLLRRPNPRAFLKHLRRPATRQLAIALIQTADTLPSQDWLRMIAARDEQQWDAAFAVSQVCDRHAMNALIQLAWSPETARPAMMALLISPCQDARRFVAFAEQDERLVAQLIVAKQKLKDWENRFDVAPPLQQVGL